MKYSKMVHDHDFTKFSIIPSVTLSVIYCCHCSDSTVLCVYWLWFVTGNGFGMWNCAVCDMIIMNNDNHPSALPLLNHGKSVTMHTRLQ